jgi:hypothetical protein
MTERARTRRGAYSHRTVIVRGTVTGTITAGDNVVVSETGSVEGDIISPQLADGAVLRGRGDTLTGQTETNNVQLDAMSNDRGLGPGFDSGLRPRSTRTSTAAIAEPDPLHGDYGAAVRRRAVWSIIRGRVGTADAGHQSVAGVSKV